MIAKEYYSANEAFVDLFYEIRSRGSVGTGRKYFTNVTVSIACPQHVDITCEWFPRGKRNEDTTLLPNFKHLIGIDKDVSSINALHNPTDLVHEFTYFHEFLAKNQKTNLEYKYLSGHITHHFTELYILEEDLLLPEYYYRDVVKLAGGMKVVFPDKVDKSIVRGAMPD